MEVYLVGSLRGVSKGKHFGHYILDGYFVCNPGFFGGVALVNSRVVGLLDFVEVTGKVDFDGSVCLLLHLFLILASPRVHCLARGFGDDLIFHGKG